MIGRSPFALLVSHDNDATQQKLDVRGADLKVGFDTQRKCTLLVDVGVILAYMCVKLLVRLYVCHRVGPFWVHFGSILGPFCVHFVSILGPFWVHFAYCLNVDAS